MFSLSSIKRCLPLLISAGLLIAAGWLLVPILLEYCGIGTATVQAQITAADSYSYSAPIGKNTREQRTGTRYTLQFDYKGQQIEQAVSISQGGLGAGTGTEIEIELTEAMPPSIIRVNGKWLPQRNLFPGVILLLAAIVQWATRNGIKTAKPRLL